MQMPCNCKFAKYSQGHSQTFKNGKASVKNAKGVEAEYEQARVWI